MNPVEAWGEVTYRPYWPQPRCLVTDGPHLMQRTARIWVCNECEAWFHEDEFPRIERNARVIAELESGHRN